MANKRRRSNHKLDVFKKRIQGEGKGHPAYIYEKIGDEYKYIGLTTSEKIKFKNGVEIITIKLINNPNPNSKEISYVMPYSEQRPTTHFGRKFKNWKFSFKDNETIENIKNKKSPKGLLYERRQYIIKYM